MGTWSKTIMGGDTPLDIEGLIYEQCGIEMFPEVSDEEEELPKQEVPKEILEAKQEELLDACVDEDEDGPMVLAVVMMRGGARINDKVKKAAIQAAHDDEWAQEDKERKVHVDKFITTLQKYDGVTPTDIDEEGLFDKLFNL